jgi:hypothetical protein
MLQQHMAHGGTPRRVVEPANIPIEQREGNHWETKEPVTSQKFQNKQNEFP